MANKGVTGGPARSIKWGEINFTPTMDGEPEFELGERDYEAKVGGNGDVYAEGAAIVQYFQHDVNMNTTEYNDVLALKDGNARSGTVTLPNGDVLSLNGILDGEFKLANGTATLKISGSVIKQ